MAKQNTFLLLIAICSMTFVVNSKLERSLKYLKSKSAPYAYPIGVCYPKVMGGYVSSIKLECEDDCDRQDNCDRNVVAYHYRTENCGGKAKFTDTFTSNDKEKYPHNCFEEDEVTGERAANRQNYAQNYMVVKISRGEWVNVTINDTETEEQCVKNVNHSFYKTFPAITNMCLLGWYNNTPFWYKAQCNEQAAYLESWNGFNCTGNQTNGYPVYKPNGCGERSFLGQYYYTEVIECTHPNYTIGIGVRIGHNNVISIIFIFIIAIYNTQ